jgi:MtN3 and saliva related transmembrane protein
MAWILGWLSSLILLATLGKQVHKQWRERRHEGVSKWLFRGQIAASLGFTVYSLLVREWIFVVTNALILLSAVAGWLVNRRNRTRAAEVRQPQGPTRRRSTPTPLPDPGFHRIPG